ncbi:hypothetical protein ABTN26_18905, partial [Acinetobacter baumannii]
GLKAEVDISAKLTGLVVGDAVRLRAALENLIDNAVKFTEQGVVALKVAPWGPGKGKTKKKAKASSRIGVAFAVSDSGIGLTLPEIR